MWEYADFFAGSVDVGLLHTLVTRHHEHPDFPPDLRVQDIDDDFTRSLATVVSEADNLSSAERDRNRPYGEDHPDWRTVPLASVFSRVELEKVQTQEIPRYRPAQLADHRSIRFCFPEHFASYETEELDRIIQAFESDMANLTASLPKGDFDCLLTHLAGLLQKYTWCVPSNTQEEFPDVSLFDHLKTTAAIAACLYRYHESTSTLDEKAIKKEAPKFLMLVGDLSGIQNYIFDISRSGHSGVARRLRARSLFVQLLTETASHKLLHALDLPMPNTLMSSGGKFYLLAPNTDEAKEKIAGVRQEIEQWLLEELHGEITLNLATVDFGRSGFKRFGDILHQAHTELQRVKLQTMFPVLQNGNAWNETAFLREQIVYGPDGPCKACKKMPRSVGDLCRRCEMDDEWGRKLPRTRYISFHDKKADGDFDIYGYSVALHTDEERSFNSRPYLIWKLNTGEVGDLTAWPAVPRYLANHIPTMETVNCENCSNKQCEERERDKRKDEPATFNCLAHIPNGRPLLGFLKADVDNLGKMFAFGLKRDSEKQYDSVSRLATLSRMLDLFFNGWLEHLTNVDFPHCYTVFSGGDDLFFVGPWQEILKLARRIREDFGLYTGNPEMTLSAAVFMNKPGYPVSRAAAEADENLETAKKREGKDGLWVLGHTLSWDEWDSVCGEWKKLAESGEDISSGFLYNLLRYARMWEDYKRGNVLGLRFQPLLAYDIARNIAPKKATVMQQWAGRLLKMPIDGEARRILDNLELIASLIIFSRRGG